MSVGRKKSSVQRLKLLLASAILTAIPLAICSYGAGAFADRSSIAAFMLQLVLIFPFAFGAVCITQSLKSKFAFYGNASKAILHGKIALVSYVATALAISIGLSASDYILNGDTHIVLFWVLRGPLFALTVVFISWPLLEALTWKNQS